LSNAIEKPILSIESENPKYGNSRRGRSFLVLQRRSSEEADMILIMKILAIPLLLGCGLAYGDSFRCGKSIIEEGNSTFRLIRKCGRPDWVEVVEKQIPMRVYQEYLGRYMYDYTTVRYEEWTYNLGPHQFMRRLRIQHGKITRIETLERGH
jgi:hypothetical protein